MKIDLIDNNNKELYEVLKNILPKCKKFDFIVSFIRFSGIQLLLDTFAELETKGIEGRIITTNYMAITERKALETILKFKNIKLRFYDARKSGFHPKGYIFYFKDDISIIIGSSNLTKGGIKSNIEWSIENIISKEDKRSSKILDEYENMWNQSLDYDKKYFNKKIKTQIKTMIANTTNENLFEEDIFSVAEEHKNFLEEEIKQNKELIEPNIMQEEGLENLKKFREYNIDKALAISATGTGKTYLSAFDVRNFEAGKLLFIVHREEILHTAKKTFEKVIPFKKMGLYTGNTKDTSADYIFSTIQTISRYYKNFSENEFDYIIIDEVHHLGGESYQKVFNYFKPKFLLGLTATPERCDGFNIYKKFDGNVAIDIRLRKAIEEGVIIPFHYYGIKEIDGVDLSNVDINKFDEVAKKLMINARTDYIIEKMNFYGYSGNKRKVLGFCVTVEHANYMAKEFNKRGIKSVALTGENNIEYRKSIISRFENDNDDLEVIFVVDIFNEGIDIPCINMVLMLRPTNSPIIFTQQLGRGLRKFEDKEFLTVLDFIGNHKKSYLIALALLGDKKYDKDSLKVAVKTDFSNISKKVHISMDEITKDQILKQLENENFSSIKYLKEEYRDFKRVLKGEIPRYFDFLNYDEAPNIFRFLKAGKGTYAGFVKKCDDSILETDEEGFKILKEIEGMLPIRRIHEFILIKYLLNNESISIQQAKIEILKYIESTDENTIIYSMENLSKVYFSDKEKIKETILFDFKEKSLFKTQKFTDYLQNENFYNYISEVVEFGIIKYEKEFGTKDYTKSIFKLYSYYSQKEALILSKLKRSPSSCREGILSTNDGFLIFINLKKDEDIKDSINYKDKIIDNFHIQWETQNSTSTDSPVGKKLINNINENIKLYIFVRKIKEIDKITQPFMYIGTGDIIKYKNNKPITTIIKLHNKISGNIYNDLTVI